MGVFVNDELFVGGLAVLLSLIFLAFAVGPWAAPYRLGATNAIVKRFGKTAARLFWITLSIFVGLVGIAILTGMRPRYAVSQPMHRQMAKRLVASVDATNVNDRVIGFANPLATESNRRTFQNRMV